MRGKAIMKKHLLESGCWKTNLAEHLPTAAAGAAAAAAARAAAAGAAAARTGIAACQS